MNQMDFCLSSSLTEALKTLSSEPGRGPLHLAQTQQVSLSLWTERSRPPAVASFHLVQAAMCTEGKSVSQAGCADPDTGVQRQGCTSKQVCVGTEPSGVSSLGLPRRDQGRGQSEKNHKDPQGPLRQMVHVQIQASAQERAWPTFGENGCLSSDLVLSRENSIGKALGDCDQGVVGLASESSPSRPHVGCADPRVWDRSSCAKALGLDNAQLSERKRTPIGGHPHRREALGHGLALATHNKLSVVDKPHACPQCGKLFNQWHSLHEHRRIHTGEKPFACGQCGRAFTHSSTLTRHLRTHTGERPHACGACGKAFNRISSLTRHHRTHTGEKPYACGACGKTFSDRSSLNQHERTHTGQNPYACGRCGRAFSQRSSLVRHQRMHTGEKPYRCSQCGKAFSQSSSLGTHQKTHASPGPVRSSPVGQPSAPAATSWGVSAGQENKPARVTSCTLRGRGRKRGLWMSEIAI
uniref:C2H2-type domain-containing protein n=1 Tax=Castor canadensis TaxID=51338 RepID=A0A8C0WCA7_CASCN